MLRHTNTCLPLPTSAGRRAFTLIELMVVALIMLVIAVVTVSMINITIDGDKVRAGSRQVQSYLEGARSRAIYSKEPRGVRFLLDPTDPRTVSSMVYIAPTDPWDEGTVVLERPDGDNDGNPAWNDTNDPLHLLPHVDPANPAANKDDVWVLRGFDGAETNPPFSTNSPAKSTSWKDLYDRGVLRDGNLIEIPPGSKNWYAIDTRLLKLADVSDGNPPVRLLLQSRYRSQANTPSTAVFAFNQPTRYRLQLSPAPLPNQEPVQLPKGVVIHLDRCSTDPDGRFPSAASAPNPSRDPTLRGNKLPPTWRIRVPTTVDPTGFVYSPYCDLMFSPRGAVTGPEASSGLIHLYVGEQKDADRDRADWSQPAPGAGATYGWTAPEYIGGQTASDPSGPAYVRGDKTVVSVFTRTGAVRTSPIHPNDDLSPSSSTLGIRFFYSETGEVAGK